MLPLIFIVPAAVTGAAGVRKNIKAIVDNNTAKDIREEANNKLGAAADRLDSLRVKCKESLEDLGKIKICMLEGSVKSFLYLFEKLKNVDFQESEGLRELKKLNIENKDFQEIGSIENLIGNVAEGVLAGASSGALTAVGAYSAATALASASTGTAISALSGAAAKNATLAFFGGGSLATGGAGMAGGAIVLGGLVAGPALLVMGMVTGSKAGAELEHAKASLAEAKTVCEEMIAGGDECIAIRRRSYMLYNLLCRLDSRIIPLLFNMESIINEEGVDYSQFKEDSKNVIAEAASLAATIKAVIDTPILKEDGSLTDESKLMLDATLKDMSA